MYDLSFIELLKAESLTGDHRLTEIWNERINRVRKLENSELILGKGIEIRQNYSALSWPVLQIAVCVLVLST